MKEDKRNIGLAAIVESTIPWETAKMKSQVLRGTAALLSGGRSREMVLAELEYCSGTYQRAETAYLQLTSEKLRKLETGRELFSSDELTGWLGMAADKLEEPLKILNQYLEEDTAVTRRIAMKRYLFMVVKDIDLSSFGPAGVALRQIAQEFMDESLKRMNERN